MMLILIIIALFAFMMIRKPVFIAYAGYSGSALLYIMHSDGNAFKYIWPGSPQFNNYASIALGSSIIVFGALFAMIFLQTRRYHPLVDKMLTGVVLLTFGMLAASAFLDNQTIKKMLVLIAFLAIISFVVSGLVAARLRFKQVRFYVIAWTGAVASSALMTGRHWFGIEISGELQLDSMRIVMVSDAALMGLAIWDYFNQLRQARQAALRDSLDKSIHNLELNNRLQNLEEQYAMVRDIAEQKGRQFIDAIHDLNQPLHALRLDLRRLVSNPAAGAQSRKRIEDTLVYLENLVTGQLDKAITGITLSEDDRPCRDSVEQLGVGDILTAIHEMFQSDAREKDLELRYVHTTLQTRVTPLVLMRIVTNLVSNAIKYTSQGRILIGCRRKGKMLSVEVHDTGFGMTQEDFRKAASRAVRLETGDGSAEGYGLGLSIACSLAADYGLTLNMASNRTGGTSFKLAVPGSDPARLD
jgi:signal transduction histidine kinase